MQADNHFAAFLDVAGNDLGHAAVSQPQANIDSLRAAIFEGMRDKFKAIRDLPDTEKSKAQERNRAEIREKVAALLAPEQKKRYEEMALEAQAARAQRRRYQADAT